MFLNYKIKINYDTRKNLFSIQNNANKHDIKSSVNIYIRPFQKNINMPNNINIEQKSVDIIISKYINKNPVIQRNSTEINYFKKEDLLVKFIHQ